MEAETEKKRTPWYEDYVGKVVGFIVKTRHERFLPIIGSCIENDEDDDCFIFVMAKEQQHVTIEGALAALDDASSQLHHIFRKPVPSSGTGTWLIQLVREETGTDPRLRG